MNEAMLEVIRQRKSQRLIAFDRKRPITKEEMKKLLDAARWAPSAHNMQNYELVVVDDGKLLEEIGNIQFHISDTWLKENYQNISLTEEAGIFERSTNKRGKSFLYMRLVFKEC